MAVALANDSLCMVLCCVYTRIRRRFFGTLTDLVCFGLDV